MSPSRLAWRDSEKDLRSYAQAREEQLQSIVFFELMDRAVRLPCGHAVDEQDVMAMHRAGMSECPSCPHPLSHPVDLLDLLDRSLAHLAATAMPEADRHGQDTVYVVDQIVLDGAYERAQTHIMGLIHGVNPKSKKERAYARCMCVFIRKLLHTMPAHLDGQAKDRLHRVLDFFIHSPASPIGPPRTS